MATSTLYAVVLLAAVTVFSVTKADDACPPSNDIRPCTCDGEGFSCLGKISLEQIKRAFQAKFKYGGVRSLWIQATPITRVPGDLFGNIVVQQAYIEMTNATHIDLSSLKGSTETLYILSLFGNKLTTFDYANLPMYRIMTTLNIGKNLLTSIPDNGFKSFFLRNLILAQNKIETVGRDAFKGLDNVIYIDLSQNSIKALGPHSFRLISPNSQINLISNQISVVSDTAFEGTNLQILRLAANRLTSLTYEAFGDLVKRIAQQGGFIDASANPLSCKGCDYTWLVNNKAVLIRVILGFACPNGSDLHSLTRESIQC